MRHRQRLIDLDRFPIDRPESDEYRALVQRCRDGLERTGHFSLDGFLEADACAHAVREITPAMAAESFTHSRDHNIYFLDHAPGVPDDHPALRKVTTTNHTLCADQMNGWVVMRVYEYEPLRRFIAHVMGMAELFLMDDPLACANVMAYYDGEALNWHFDRSEFTVTLLLQTPEAGGEFEYRPDLRGDSDPNYDGVALLLEDRDPKKRMLALGAGDLNVFRGKNTAHRLTPVRGPRPRLVAVFSYYEFPGRQFSDEERIGFYGRAG